MTQLTPHFAVEEFDQPARHGFEARAYPVHWIRSRLLPLCDVLEVLRADLGRPIHITSGYRSEQYNRGIGGARLSQHVQGRAADIQVEGLRADDVLGRAIALHRLGVHLPGGGVFHLGGLGRYETFIHIDLRPGSQLVRWSGTRAGS